MSNLKKVKIKNVRNFSQKFLDLLVESDFIFIQSIYSSRSVGTVASYLNLFKNSHFHVLDILKLNTHLKQLIRILQEVRFMPFKSLQLISIDKNFKQIFDYFVANTQSRIFRKIALNTSIPRLELAGYPASFYLILGQIWNKRQIIFQVSNILRNGTYFVSILNLTTKITGVYRVYNELADYKKSIFLFILLEKIFAIRKKKAKKLTKKKTSIVKKQSIGLKSPKILKVKPQGKFKKNKRTLNKKK